MATRYEGADIDFVRYRGAVAAEFRLAGEPAFQGVTGPSVAIDAVFNNTNTEATLTATATGSGTLTYFWRNVADPTTRLNDNDSDVDIVVTTSGTYEVVVNDDTGETIVCDVIEINTLASGSINGAPATRTAGQTISGVTVTVNDTSHTPTWRVYFNNTLIDSGTGNVANDPIPNQTARSSAGTDTYRLEVDDPGSTTNPVVNISHNISVTVPAVAGQGTTTVTGLTVGGTTYTVGGNIPLSEFTAGTVINITGSYNTTRAASGSAPAGVRAFIGSSAPTGLRGSGFGTNAIIASSTGSGTFDTSYTLNVTVPATGAVRITWGNGVNPKARFNYHDSSASTLFTIT